MTNMTPEQRLDRIEHLLYSHIEQAKKDYEENRRLWRDQQVSIEAIWKAIADRDRKTDERFEQTSAQIRDFIEEGRQLDARIGKLVSSMGEFIAKQDTILAHIQKR